MKNEINRALVAKKKIFSLFAALTLSAGLWAANSVITYTANAKLNTTEVVDDKGSYGLNINQFFDADGQKLTVTQSFDESTKTGTISFNGELKTIGEYAFFCCSSQASEEVEYTVSSLESIVIPEGVTTIGEGAFMFCLELTSITLPTSIVEIGDYAFASLISLTDLKVSWITTLPTLGKNVFNNVSVGNVTLHVPAGSKALYQSDDQWKNFGSIVESAPTVSTTYLDENGESQTADALEITNASEVVTWGTAGTTTWYVVKGENVQLSKGAVCAGDVRLILADGAKLTATGVQDYNDFTLTPGIEVSGEGNSFIIYAQSTGEQMGQLVAQSDGASGIGGSFSSPNSFNIIINGGKITATGSGAGIGGGQDGSASNITINGGIVEANGYMGAGIGGGHSSQWEVNTFGSNITINGGVVTASSVSGAGIGGGCQGSASNITINGGIVTTTGGEYSAGIGGSNGGDCINIVINGGTIIAIGDEFNPAIGGMEATISDIYISDAYNLYGGENKDNTSLIPHSSAQDLTDILSGWPQYYEYVKIEGLATPYTRTMSVDQWATVCLPYAATSFSGATFYKVNYYDASDPSDLKLYIEPVSTLAAGMPYIFQATATTVTINHEATTPLAYGEVDDERGLHGSFARTIIESDGNMAAISSNQVIIAEDEAMVTVPACRAYIDMKEVSGYELPHTAPLRCIGVPSKNPTGFEQSVISNQQSAMKVLKNGQLLIIRDDKTYNAQGIEL